MKKIIVFCLLLSILCSTALVKIETNPLFQTEGVEQVCIVSSSKILDESVSNVACGDKFFNYCSFSTAKQNIKKWKNVLNSLQFYYDDMQLQEVFEVLRFSEISSQEIDGLTVYYGYTPYYQDCVLIDGKKVNVQIAVSDGKVIAGFPMILTGY